jgi:hypothetical protein
MPRKEKDLLVQGDRIAGAWERTHPNKTFSGLTLEAFREILAPCRAVRKELAEIAQRAKILRFRLRNVDGEARPAIQRVVHSVRGDADVGDDSPMYRAMGYVPRSKRKKRRRRAKAKAARG